MLQAFFWPGSFPGYIPDRCRCRCRDRNRNRELGQSGVSITTTTTAALIMTTRSGTRTGTYARTILNQAFFLCHPHEGWNTSQFALLIHASQDAPSFGQQRAR